MPTFRAYDANACGYPRAAIPVVPLPQANLFGRGASARHPSCFRTDRANGFARGRYALHHALRAVGVDERHAVALPSYHCRTMIDPVLRMGADLAWFALREDLSPDLPHLASAVSASAKPVRALLLPHYFGFAQDVAPTLEYCHAHGITLIEDCCHAYFGARDGRVIGTQGDCAIGSPGKFFAHDEGGSFVDNRRAGDVELSAQSPIEELRAVYRFAAATWHQATRGPGADAHVDLVARFAEVRAKFPAGAGDLVADESRSLSDHYEVALESVHATRWLTWVRRLTGVEYLCERRRANYERLLAGVRGLPHCRPLFATLPDGVVPYMFPLLIDLPAQRFHWLKHLGMPMYRWDELADTDCPVASHYRLHLVHLPCHQSMRPRDIEWMLHALALVMKTDSPDSGETPLESPRFAVGGRV